MSSGRFLKLILRMRHYFNINIELLSDIYLRLN